MNNLAARLLPSGIKHRVRLALESRSLRAVPVQSASSDLLRQASDVDLEDWLHPSSRLDGLSQLDESLTRIEIPDGTGGVNPGDRRAVFCLVRSLKARTVLEIGTHIGASLVYIASAMSQMPDGQSRRLVTIDVADVNDSQSRPWETYGASRSPRQIMETLGYDSFVEFRQQPSLDYFADSRDTFDFIFLDGDHSAATVYREIPAALRHLNEEGVILLHDYFPDLRALWPHTPPIPGPYLALERLKSEGLPLGALPLGELPWRTKKGTNMTSLALLTRG